MWGRYRLFVTEGCKTAPTNPPVGTSECPPKGTGWVHMDGPDKGALGDGWYKDAINLTPYTISTATSGSCKPPRYRWHLGCILLIVDLSIVVFLSLSSYRRFLFVVYVSLSS